MYGVDSDLVAAYDYDEVAPMFIVLLAPLSFLASSFKIPQVSFVWVVIHFCITRTTAGTMPWVGLVVIQA